MDYLITKIVFWLAMAHILGFAIGFIIRGRGANKKADILTRTLRETQADARALRKRCKDLESEVAAKPAAAKAPAENAPVVKTEAKKAPAKTTAPKKVSPKKVATKKAVAKKAVTKKAAPKKAAAKPTPAKKPADNDLKKIKGIGPALEKKLKAMGISSYAQIAAFNAAEVDRVNAELSFKGRIQREDWIKQAKALT